MTNSVPFCADRFAAKKDNSNRADKHKEEFTAGPLRNGTAHFHTNSAREINVFYLSPPKFPRDPAQGEKRALRAILMPETILQVRGGFQAFSETIHANAPKTGGFSVSFYIVTLVLCLLRKSTQGDFRKSARN
jgi:hypothetical protein